MVYRMPRPTARAARNFLVGYCMAPAAKCMGTIGNGGGSIAGIATDTRPQRSKIAYTLAVFLCENLFSRVSFPPLRAMRYISLATRTDLPRAIIAVEWHILRSD